MILPAVAQKLFAPVYNVKTPMQKLLGPLLLATALISTLSGCNGEQAGAPEGAGERPNLNGSGNYALVPANPVGGPAGGEVSDMTTPVGVNATTGGDQTNMVFPSTAQPH